MNIAIFTINTELYQSGTESISGLAMRAAIEKMGFTVKANRLLPADKSVVSAVLNQLCHSGAVDIIITLGNNGHRLTDIAPNAVEEVATQMLPGMAEAIRALNLTHSRRAMLDRSVVGYKNKTLMANLPEKAKAAIEDITLIMPELVHAVGTLNDENNVS